jgi:hypothetical protein
MYLGPLTPRLTFPGRAGALQASGATAALVRELGDNYVTYHAFLASTLEATGGRPDPVDYGNDMVAYYEASDRFADLVIAEVLLRRCRAFRQRGSSLDESDASDPPTLDEGHRLVSVETGQPTSAALPSGEANPRYWTRPLSPPEQ